MRYSWAMDEMTRVMLGLPAWTTYVRGLNTLNSLAAVGLSIWTALSTSFHAGALYFVVYWVVWGVISFVGSMLARRDAISLLPLIMLSTAILIGTNVALAVYFLFASGGGAR